MTGKLTPANGMLRIPVPGSLLSANANRFLENALATIDGQSCGGLKFIGVEFDFTGAHNVDSAGLNALISVIRLLKMEGKRTSIRVQDTYIHRIFLFTRLDRQAEIVRI